MIRYHASWILPISEPPVRDGWIAVDRGRVVAYGSAGRSALGADPVREVDFGQVAIMPGLVNAHTHLELSWMAGLVPPSASMNDWVRALMQLRRAESPGPQAELQAARDAAHAMREGGTVLVGDVSNGLGVVAALAEADLGGVVFHELLGFNAMNPAAMVREAWGKKTDVGCRF